MIRQQENATFPCCFFSHVVFPPGIGLPGGKLMAMSWIWVGMLTISLLCGVLNGAGDLGRAAMEGAGKAVSLCVSLTGSLCLWSGFAAVLERSGLQARLARVLTPVLGRLYPTARRDKAAMGALCGNVTANFLGLGSAATPLGIEAVRRMQALSGSDAASDEMCRLVVMNTASIQLLPTTVAALRASLGAAAPFDILPAVWLTSFFSVSAGLLAAALLRRLGGLRTGRPVRI